MQKLKGTSIINVPFRLLIKKAGQLLSPAIWKFGIKHLRVVGTHKVSIHSLLKFKFYSNGDDGIADQLFYDPSEYSEINELILFYKLSEQSAFIFDLGANTGLYSIAASIANKNSKIWAFEPYTPNFERLKKNITLNSISNVAIVQKAIGADNCTVSFTCPETDQICDVLSVDRNFTEKFYKEWITYKQIPVEQVSVDSFMTTQHITTIDLIKIDVENYELEVLKGAQHSLLQHTPVILCEMFVNESRTLFFEEFLKPMGYFCYMITKTELVHCEKLTANSSGRNYIFSTRKTIASITPLSALDSIVNAFIGKK